MARKPNEQQPLHEDRSREKEKQAEERLPRPGSDPDFDSDITKSEKPEKPERRGR